MSVDRLTIEAMKALPSALRPNPHSIDDAVVTACGLGWTPYDLARAAYQTERAPNPGLVVHNIRALSKLPPRPQTPTPPKVTTPREPGIPMPDYVREAMKAAGITRKGVGGVGAYG